jgi:hypothetical protein
MMTGKLVNWLLATGQNAKMPLAGSCFLLNFCPTASSQWPVGQVIVQ